MILLCWLLLVGDAAAQQVTTDPSSTHIFPAGGRRGTRVQLKVGGECLPPGTRFRLFGEGISASPELGSPVLGQYAPSPRRRPGEQQVTYPREWQSQVDINDDAPLGIKLWRLSCARGGTGGRPFVVGDLPEYLEVEPNSHPDVAERVELPVTINGQIAGESDLDYFRFQATVGEVVRVDVAAARLGSALDPVIQVFGPDGKRAAADDQRIGADPVLAFRPQVSGEYRLLIMNVTFRGGPSFVYRATLSAEPLVQYAFPSGGQVGTTRDIEYFALSGNGFVQTLTGSVTFPKFGGEFSQQSPAWPKQSPRAANDGSTELRTPLGHIQSNTVPLIAGLLPEEIEPANNDSRESATELIWPVVMNGQFESNWDEDWFRLTCRQGTPLSIECTAQPRWSPSLPIVTVTNTAGTVLTSVSAVQTARGIVRIEWQPPTDGVYYLQLRDLQQGIRGGSEFIYRLSVNEAAADFAVSLKIDAISVVQGSRAEIDVSVERRGGCVAPVELIVEGLPDGVRLEGQQVAADQTTTKLAFIADAEARSSDVTLRIRGQAQINGKSVEHPCQATHLGHDVDGVGLGAVDVDHVQLTVVHKPVFKLYCNEAYQYAHRGTIYPYLMEVERLDGFDGPIKLQVADRQIKDLDGIEVVTTTIEPGQPTVMLPVYLPETMHINVQAHSNVYAQGHVEFQDKFGQKQTLLVVSTMRCMIRTLPTVARLRPSSSEQTAQVGRAIKCLLAVDRTSQFAGPMQIELIDAAPGITATPTTITANQSQIEIEVQIDPALKPRSDLTLKFRARGNMAGDVQVICETKVPIRFTNEFGSEKPPQ